MAVRPLIPRKNLADLVSPAAALANLGGQPADPDLTAIAALTTQAFGRSVLTTADAAALRDLAGLASDDAVTYQRVELIGSNSGIRLFNRPTGTAGFEWYVPNIGTLRLYDYGTGTNIVDITSNGDLKPAGKLHPGPQNANVYAEQSNGQFIIRPELRVFNTVGNGFGPGYFSDVNATGTISSPGAGPNSEHVGANSTAAGNSAVSLGNTATAAGVAGVAVGASANATANNTTAIGANTNVTATNSIAIGRYSVCSVPNTLVIGAGTGGAQINDAYIGNGVTNATPSGFSMRGTGGSGTNVSGAKARLTGGLSTGNAAPGLTVLGSSVQGSSGSTVQTEHDSFAVVRPGNFLFRQATGYRQWGLFAAGPTWWYMATHRPGAENNPYADDSNDAGFSIVSNEGLSFGDRLGAGNTIPSLIFGRYDNGLAIGQPHMVIGSVNNVYSPVNHVLFIGECRAGTNAIPTSGRICAPLGSGNATAAKLILQGAVSGTSGTTRHTRVDALEIDGATTNALGDMNVSGKMTVGARTFGTLPSPSANPGAVFRLSDRGQKHVYSDGTNWLWLHDNTIAS